MEAGSLKTWPVRMVKVVSSSLQPITKLMPMINTTKTSIVVFMSTICRNMSVADVNVEAGLLLLILIHQAGAGRNHQVKCHHFGEHHLLVAISLANTIVIV